MIQPIKLRIFLVDDHAAVRKLLMARLKRESDFEVIAAVNDSFQILPQAQSKQPDLILIDPMMHDGLGLATLRQLRINLPKIIVVVLTAVADTTLKIQLNEMGIVHILSKGISTSELLSELRSAARPLTRPAS